MRAYLYNIATDKSKGFVPALIRPFLLLLAVIYGLLVRVLPLFYGIKRRSLGCKVISVGNITLGGSGKTALVEFIAKLLREEGHKVAILTRGYKRKITDYGLPAYRQAGGITDYETMGDEPYMLLKNLGDIPVIVDKDRVRGARQAIKDYQADTVILDDGFQQWRIRKDLEIVTIDCTEPFGNRHLLPRGILREPLSALKRADIFILTKINLNPDYQGIKAFLGRINPSAGVFESAHNPAGFYKLGRKDETVNEDTLKGKGVTLVSGIGAPDSFENLISILGINIGLSFRFPDHHNYSQRDLENIISASQEKNIDTVITTEKDAARLISILNTQYSIQILVLRIELKITKDEEGFRSRLLKLYSL